MKVQVNAATPNGIAMEMLHSLSGNLLATQVSDCIGTDAPYCAIATEGSGTVGLIAVNTSYESVPALLEVEGLADGEYRAEIYSCNLFENNIVYRKGRGDGTLAMTRSLTLTAENGRLSHMELLDKDCFVMVKLHK